MRGRYPELDLQPTVAGIFLAHYVSSASKAAPLELSAFVPALVAGLRAEASGLASAHLGLLRPKLGEAQVRACVCAYVSLVLMCDFALRAMFIVEHWMCAVCVSDAWRMDRTRPGVVRAQANDVAAAAAATVANDEAAAAPARASPAAGRARGLAGAGGGGAGARSAAVVDRRRSLVLAPRAAAAVARARVDDNGEEVAATTPAHL
jgi:hypothetical protein